MTVAKLWFEANTACFNPARKNSCFCLAAVVRKPGSAVTTLTFIYDSLPDQLVLELVDLVLNYEESSVLSEGASNVLLRDLDQVMTHIDQNNMQGVCDGMVTFIKVAEELASKGSIEVGAAMLLIAEANQISADLYCS